MNKTKQNKAAGQSLDEIAHEKAIKKSHEHKNKIVYVVRNDEGENTVVVGEPGKKHGGIVAGYVNGVRKLQVA